MSSQICNDSPCVVDDILLLKASPRLISSVSSRRANFSPLKSGHLTNVKPMDKKASTTGKKVVVQQQRLTKLRKKILDDSPPVDDFVRIVALPTKKKLVLTEHQKEKFMEKKEMPFISQKEQSNGYANIGGMFSTESQLMNELQVSASINGNSSLEPEEIIIDDTPPPSPLQCPAIAPVVLLEKLSPTAIQKINEKNIASDDSITINANEIYRSVHLPKNRSKNWRRSKSDTEMVQKSNVPPLLPENNSLDLIPASPPTSLKHQSPLSLQKFQNLQKKANLATKKDITCEDTEKELKFSRIPDTMSDVNIEHIEKAVCLEKSFAVADQLTDFTWCRERHGDNGAEIIFSANQVFCEKIDNSRVLSVDEILDQNLTDQFQAEGTELLEKSVKDKFSEKIDDLKLFSKIGCIGNLENAMEDSKDFSTPTKNSFDAVGAQSRVNLNKFDVKDEGEMMPKNLCVADDNEEEVCRLSSNFPLFSPASTPSASILKRKIWQNLNQLNKSPVVSSCPSPVSVNKKVHFAPDLIFQSDDEMDKVKSPPRKMPRFDWLSPEIKRRSLRKKAADMCGPTTFAQKFSPRTITLVSLVSAAAKPQKLTDTYPSVQSSAVSSVDNRVTMTKESSLGKSQCIWPSLSGDDTKIDVLIQSLTDEAWQPGLLKFLENRSITTVGHFACLTELDVHFLPIRQPKIQTAHLALEKFACFSPNESNACVPDATNSDLDISGVMPIEDLDTSGIANEKLAENVARSPVTLDVLENGTEIIFDLKNEKNDETNNEIQAEQLNHKISAEDPSLGMKIVQNTNILDVQPIANNLSPSSEEKIDGLGDDRPENNSSIDVFDENLQQIMNLISDHSSKFDTKELFRLHDSLQKAANAIISIIKLKCA